MGKSFLILLVHSISVSCILSAALYDYTSNVAFHRFKNTFDDRLTVAFNSSYADDGCSSEENFSMIVHGWLENIETTGWIYETVQQLLKHRGGCVYLIDYALYANNSDYFQFILHFHELTSILTTKLQNLQNYDRQYCFGFSVGARLCIEAGVNVGVQKIASIELCDPAGPAFDGWFDFRGKNPTDAAKNVACINTSSDKGSIKYNCHQNFRMGKCGESQPAAGPYPLGSHGLCPYFYNLAFDHKFVPLNREKCISPNRANISSSDVRMGYLGSFDKSFVRGDIFIATTASHPYVVTEDFVENTLMEDKNKDLLSWFLGILFYPNVFVVLTRK